MIVHLDTSVLIDAFTGPRRALPRLTTLVREHHRLAICSIVLYEWLRGPRARSELAAVEAVLPSADVVPFGAKEAARAASLYRQVRRARGREIDLAIAACALTHRAGLWTLNGADFEDIPDLDVL